MITRDLIEKNEILKGLSEEQISAIETISKNDENAVIGSRISEIYSQLDNDIATVAGVKKEPTEKTYDYAKRVISDFAQKANSVSDYETKINELVFAKKDLERQIKDGSGDKKTALELAQTKAELEATKAQFNQISEQFQQEKSNFENQLKSTKIDFLLSAQKEQFKIKKDLPEPLKQQLTSELIGKLKSDYKVDFVGDNVAFFDKSTGAILNNPENKLNPFTPAELINAELKRLGVYDEGTPAKVGAGTEPPKTATRYGSVQEPKIDLSGAKTRTEAIQMANKQLREQNVAAGSKAAQSAINKAWAEFGIKNLEN